MPRVQLHVKVFRALPATSLHISSRPLGYKANDHKGVYIYHNHISRLSPYVVVFNPNQWSKILRSLYCINPIILIALVDIVNPEATAQVSKSMPYGAVYVLKTQNLQLLTTVELTICSMQLSHMAVYNMYASIYYLLGFQCPVTMQCKTTFYSRPGNSLQS